MKLVDFHCHLTHEYFKDKLEETIEKAKKAGVQAIVVSGINHPTNEEALALAKQSDIIKPSLGLYPIDLLDLPSDETGLARQTKKIDLDEELEFIKKHKDEIVAIGECGLDYFWDKKHHEKQKENFKRILEFTKKLNKPLIVHSRNAELDALEMLEESKIDPTKVILHCFEGRKHLLKRAIKAGFNFTIPAKVGKQQHFQILTELADLKQLLTETDAPWLSPFPDKKNEPAFITESIKKIAEIKKISKEAVAKQIWENYERIIK